MRFGSVCSGIEAASVAWHPLGWTAAWLSEIEKFPSAVLAHHYPDVPNLGDMTALSERIKSGEIEAPDLFCGGTPCQAFSVAGLRQSLDDARGNLSLTFCEIANEIDSRRDQLGLNPCIVFWENVPGVLNTKDNAFGCFLAGLAGEDAPLQPAGGKWTNAGCVLGPKRAVAWRTLDAQYFGLAQRRKRVFVVASARAGFDPAKILFEFDGMRRDTAPSRKTRQVAPTIPSRSTAGGDLGSDFDIDGGVIQTFDRQSSGEYGTAPLASTIAARDYKDATDLVVQPVANTLTSTGFEKQDCQSGTYIAEYVGNAEGGAKDVPTLTCHSTGGSAGISNQMPLVTHTPVFAIQGSVIGRNDAAGPQGDPCHTLAKANAEHASLVHPAMAVRRLTPVECERLMGFPDGYTDIKPNGKPTPDGPRYKALGNSWAVPVVRWIGERIAEQLK